MSKARRPRAVVAGIPILVSWFSVACSDTSEPGVSGPDQAGAGAGGGAAAGGFSGSGGAAGTSAAGLDGAAGSNAAAGGASGSGGVAGASGTAGASGATGAGGAAAGASGAGIGGGGASGAAGASGAPGTSGAAGASGTGGASGAGGAGAAGASGSSGGGAGGAGSAGMGGECELPSTFEWTSSAPLLVPTSTTGYDLVAVKDPTAVRFGDRIHVYASSVTSTGVYGLVYKSFTDWPQATNTPWYHMAETPGFDTYVAAPQLFFFTPQNKWYLVFQSGPPMYSTSTNPGDPTTWTRPAPFYATTPAIIEDNDGWLDFWVICDSESCHLFFSDDHGRWYKSKTSLASFPNGFGDPVIVMQDADAGRLFEACNVYKVAGTNEYLAVIEAFDSTSNWRRYFRSWTSSSLEGPWQPLADSGSNPFAGTSNVTFDGTPWTNDISHGELVRTHHDQTLTIDACRLEYVYQGFDPAADTTNYNAIPWNLGLLTATTNR